MFRIAIIGTGNVSWHLCRALRSVKKFKLTAVIGRAGDTPAGFEEFPYFSSLAEATTADIYLLCVADQAIKEVANLLNGKQALVLHTSGSTPLSILADLENTGVLYPLQSFTRGRPVDLPSVPFLIEANTKENLAILRQLAQVLSQNVQELDSEKRAKMHLAAAISNNFSNHLLYLSKQYCEEEKLDVNLLKPLLTETLEKAFDLEPYHAQTGPAMRGDFDTLEKHKKLIKNKALKELYTSITESILKTYGRKKL